MHDVNGKPLFVGDVVNIPCTIVDVSISNQEYCNVTVKPIHPFYPEKERRDSITLNTRQLVKMTKDISAESGYSLKSE